MNEELIEHLESYFKPEARSAGRALFSKGVVSVSLLSDTEAQGFIRSTSPLRVTLRTPSMDSLMLTVSCNCPIAKKSQLCKHAWASLLELVKSRPDFLDGKTEIEASSSMTAKDALTKDAPTKASPKLKSQSQLDTASSLKDRQNAYRKEQYQKQKQRLKAEKQPKAKISRFAEPELPDDIQEVLRYFSENGFPMEAPFQAEAVNTAKKKLSRIFHPDKGGTHEEILALNRNCEIMLEFISAN